MTDETFNLCLQVWEATGWDGDDLLHFLGGEIHYKKLFESDMHWLDTTKDTYVPVYTSDYLLERLPRTYGGVALSLWAGGSTGWIAEYDTENGGRCTGATPLTALLRLVLELKKEGKI